MTDEPDVSRLLTVATHSAIRLCLFLFCLPVGTTVDVCVSVRVEIATKLLLVGRVPY